MDSFGRTKLAGLGWPAGPGCLDTTPLVRSLDITYWPSHISQWPRHDGLPLAVAVPTGTARCLDDGQLDSLSGSGRGTLYQGKPSASFMTRLSRQRKTQLKYHLQLWHEPTRTTADSRGHKLPRVPRQTQQKLKLRPTRPSTSSASCCLGYLALRPAKPPPSPS